MGKCPYYQKVIPIERNTDVRIKCYKCGGEYTMDMMRMDPKSARLSCRNCLERKMPAPAGEDMGNAPIGQRLKPSAPEKGQDKTSYFCKACRYSFTRAPHITVADCPYCGQSGMLTKKGSASSLVREIEDMAGDEE